MDALRRPEDASSRGDTAAGQLPAAERVSGLTRRMIRASALLALIIGGAFVILLLSIRDLREAERRTAHAQDVLVAANQLERLLLDLETGQRGFVLTGEERFLQPWNAARTGFPRSSDNLVALVTDDQTAQREARQIAVRGLSYINDYSVPLVAAARRGDPSASDVAATEAGKQRVDALRASFDRLIQAERRIDARLKASADTASRRASATAVIALAASIVLIALYGAYLTRAIVKPIRRAALMAGRLAGGDLTARTPETGKAEIGVLERAFNVMGNSLERGRDELAAIAAEQAGLRRVATLVARGASPSDVFSAVAEELAQLLGADITTVLRFEDDGTATVAGGWSWSDVPLPIGARMALEGEGAAVTVKKTGQPARTERFVGPPGSVPAWIHSLGARTAVGSPILVEGVLWGVALAVFTRAERLVDDIEARIGGFTELVATAIANADARDELRRIAQEQAALRRVATLVAEGAPPSVVFDAVAENVDGLFDSDFAVLVRFESEGEVTVVGGSGQRTPGTRLHANPRLVVARVRDTGGATRFDVDDPTSPDVPEVVRAQGIRSAVASPIVVKGNLWGALSVASRRGPLPPDAESRMAGFAELVGTAIANAEAQAELTASRARIVTTADETRRRIERDLHDGAQQRLVSLALQLRAAQTAVPAELTELVAALDGVTVGLTQALDELREMARGIHPAILAEGGLGPALRTLARRSPVPVEMNVPTDARLPEQVEVAAYYVVSEALTNTAKHARASMVTVEVAQGDGVLRVGVRDDGVGGADFVRGSGLVGLKDRVEALGGRIAVDSPPNAGTSIQVELPIADRESARTL